MAFFDWNGNGKKDMADDFIEYNIFKACFEEENEEVDEFDELFDDFDEE